MIIEADGSELDFWLPEYYFPCLRAIQYPKDKEVGFVEWMEVTKPLDKVHRTLDFVSLRWSTSHDLYHTGWKSFPKCNAGETWKLYGVVPSDYLIGVAHVEVKNYQ